MSSNCALQYSSLGNGFMCEYVEESSEKPPDWLNGDCIVHYKRDGKDHQLLVNIVNGKREGEANLIYEGLVCLRLMYHDGQLTGLVERMNDFGIVEMRGHLVNGMETGLFREFDLEENVIWTGYYRNGKRYSRVVKSERLEGYYDEKSVENDFLLSMAQYDDSLHDKNGRCFECENSILRNECVYENGVKKHTVREFVDGKMIVFSLDGKKVYEGEWYGNIKDGYLCHEPMEGMEGFFKEVDSNGQLISVSQYDELNVHKNGKCFEMENGKVKRVCWYENGKMKRVMMEFSNSTMTEYDDNGKKVYEGEFKGDIKTGFVRNGHGKQYVSSSTLIGTWKDGTLNGELYEMDANGNMKRICVYEDDVMIRVIKEFQDTIMIEYDDSGNRVYEGEFRGNANDGFVRNGKGYLLNSNGESSMCLFEEGRVVRIMQELNGKLMKEYDDNGRMSYYGGFTGDTKKGFVKNEMGYLMDDQLPKRFSLFAEGSFVRMVQEFSGDAMTEFDENGKKQYVGAFKGSIQAGFVREGRGKEFTSSHGLAVYSGEWKEGKRDGFGTEFSGLKPVYIGEWKNGVRNGKGKEMDPKGKVVRNGIWVNGTWKDEKQTGGDDGKEEEKVKEPVSVPKEHDSSESTPRPSLSPLPPLPSPPSRFLVPSKQSKPLRPPPSLCDSEESYSSDSEESYSSDSEDLHTRANNPLSQDPNHFSYGHARRTNSSDSKFTDVGIYLGTTKSCVCMEKSCVCCMEKRKLLPVAVDGKYLVPSAVSYSQGYPVLGRIVQAFITRGSANIARYPRRLLGKSFNSPEVEELRNRDNCPLIEVDGKPVYAFENGTRKTPEDVCGDIIKYLLSVVKKFTEKEIGNVCITIPAQFDSNQRAAMVDAAKKAGIQEDHLSLVSEPVAAVIDYLRSNPMENGRLLVFDCDQTLDVSIIRVRNKRITVEANRVSNMGGRDVDYAILEWMKEEYKTITDDELPERDRKGTNKPLLKLLAIAEKAKNELSASQATDIDFEGIQGVDSDNCIVMTQSRLEMIIRPFVDKAMEVIEDALNACGLRREDINDVIFFGGSTEIPVMRDAILYYFNLPPKDIVNVDTIIAEGACSMFSF